MIKTWFKIFYRNSRKNWLNLIINVLGLSLGFAGLLIVLLYLNDEQDYNNSNPFKDTSYRVIHRMSDGEVWDTSTNVEGQKYVEEVPEITAIYLSDGWYMDWVVKVNEKQIYTRDMLRGEPSFFEFFPFEIIEGSIKTFEQSRNHIAISEKQAKIYFENESAIGKTISIQDKKYIVTTVYKLEGKHFFMPSAVYQNEKEPTGNWGSFSKNLFVKLTDEADLESVYKKVNDVWFRNVIEPGAKRDGIPVDEYKEKYGTEVVLESLSDIRLHTIAEEAGPEGKGSYQLILIMLSLSVLLIIISCVNFINLSIASATQRAKEVGVKKTLGLSKLSLIQQYTFEIMFQCLWAYLLALVVVELLLPSFNTFIKKEITIMVPMLLLKVFVVVIIVALVIGIVPALYLSKFKTVEVLKGNISRSKKGVFARNIMLGLQFLISGFFLVGSLIIYQQVNYMMNKDLGFEGDQVVILPMNEYNNRYQKYLLAKKELIKHPKIKVVTSNSAIIGGGSSTSTNVMYKDVSIQTELNALDYEYIDMMNIEVVKGRNLRHELTSDSTTNVMINETLAKAFNIYNDPIGKKVSTGGSGDESFEVVGVIKDYHIGGLDAKIPPMIFFHWNTIDWMKQNFWMMQVKVKNDNISETLSYIEDYWSKNVEQGYPFNPDFVNKRFARTYREYQRQKTLFFILTVIVVVMSLLGLFALATLTIQQRLKEVAIRKTLGASVKEIMQQLIKGFVKIILIASVILVPIAYYFMQNWLDNFVYRIDMPLLPFIITPIVLSILVVIVVGLKAYNATKVDLIKYLKFE